MLADGQARCQRRPRRERRRDLLPPPPGAPDRVEPPRRQISQAAGQNEGGHDIHGSIQHGSWLPGHAGADRTRWQDRRRFAGAALAGAHTSGHVRERLGHHDDGPAARVLSGRRHEPRQRRTSVDPSLRHGQHPLQRGHPSRHEGRFPTRRAVLHPTTKHVVLAALRRGRLLQHQKVHPDAGERHTCPLRHRRLVRRRGHGQSVAAPVFGRMGSSFSHGPLRYRPCVLHWLASIARTRWRRIPRCRDGGRGTPRPRSAFLQGHRAGARSW